MQLSMASSRRSTAAACPGFRAKVEPSQMLRVRPHPTKGVPHVESLDRDPARADERGRAIAGNPAPRRSPGRSATAGSGRSAAERSSGGSPASRPSSAWPVPAGSCATGIDPARGAAAGSRAAHRHPAHEHTPGRDAANGSHATFTRWPAASGNARGSHGYLCQQYPAPTARCTAILPALLGHGPRPVSAARRTAARSAQTRLIAKLKNNVPPTVGGNGGRHRQCRPLAGRGSIGPATSRNTVHPKWVPARRKIFCNARKVSIRRPTLPAAPGPSVRSARGMNGSPARLQAPAAPGSRLPGAG